MPILDALGLPLSGASAASAVAFDLGVRDLQRFVGDPVGAADAALVQTPDLVMAHVLKGYLFALSTDRSAMTAARDSFRAAEALPTTAREAAHVAALGALSCGGWHEAGRILEDLTIKHPRDALALQIGHQIDFFTGSSTMLRDRIARAMPAWDETMPGYHAVLSALAFGLEETADYARAEAAGRRAVELEPRDGWGQHAVAHVMEMQSRQHEGIAWMRAQPENWTTDSFLQVHNWWHLGLFHFELGDYAEVLGLADGPIFGKDSAVLLNMVDASALLWRLHLAGVDAGGRWQRLADLWTPHAGSSSYAFNDMHAAMAFAAAGRGADETRLIAAQDDAMRAGGDNAGFVRDVGRPVTLAIQAFGQGRYLETVRLLRPIRRHAHRFGGSHAQRDVIDLTLIEAAIRAGEAALAAALTAERSHSRPDSPLSGLFRRRAAALASPA